MAGGGGVRRRVSWRVGMAVQRLASALRMLLARRCLGVGGYACVGGRDAWGERCLREARSGLRVVVRVVGEAVAAATGSGGEWRLTDMCSVERSCCAEKRASAG